MNTSPQEGRRTTKANRRAGWPEFRSATAFGHVAVVTVPEEDCKLDDDQLGRAREYEAGEFSMESTLNGESEERILESRRSASANARH